ncbi:MAG: amidohydrolase [Treponema sp.]|nr:amidohydrolase [Treponema sp.]
MEGSRIKAAGDNESILALRKPGDEVINLEGRLLVPGFSDSHIHILMTCDQDKQLRLHGVKSGEEILKRAQSYIADRCPGPEEWIIGTGFDQSAFAIPRMPDRRLADRISCSNPVILFRVCYHVAVVNSVALTRLDLKNAGKGVEYDENGEPTGVFIENSVDYLLGIAPPSREEIERKILKMADRMLRAGITAAHSLDTGEKSNAGNIITVYRSLAKTGRLPLRVNQGIAVDSVESLEKILQWPEWNDPLPFFKLGFIKVIGDGSLGARTALLREPYADDPQTRGVANFTQEEIDKLAAICHRAGRQIAFHAIGDAMLERVLRAVEKLDNPQKLRHRVIHCMIGDDAQYRRIAKLGLCADIHPFFLIFYFSMNTRLGENRAATAYAWKSLYDLGIPLAGGSDSPVAPFNPLEAIYWAVTRQTPGGYPDGGFHPEQRLGVAEALGIYTAGAAYLAFDEHQRGTVEPGKLADFTVLTKNILRVDPGEILDTGVYQTWVNGELVYQQG